MEENPQERIDGDIEERALQEKERLIQATAKTIFESEAFKRWVKSTKYETSGISKIGQILDYLILHPEGKGLDEVLAGKHSAGTSRMIEVLLEKLNLPQPLSLENAQIAMDYLKKEFAERGYVFHGTSSAFKESIMEHGLSPEVVSENYGEIKRVADIGRKYNMSLVGWATINSEGKNFYDLEQRDIDQYLIDIFDLKDTMSQ